MREVSPVTVETVSVSELVRRGMAQRHKDDKLYVDHGQLSAILSAGGKVRTMDDGNQVLTVSYSGVVFVHACYDSCPSAARDRARRSRRTRRSSPRFHRG